MAVLENKFQELEDKLKKSEDSGGLTSTGFHIIKEQLKVIDKAIAIHTNTIKLDMCKGKPGTKLMDALKKQNIIDPDCAYKISGDPELEQIKCPIQAGKVITRSDCLKYSDMAKNGDECTSKAVNCHQFRITRDKLLGD